jgi:hypothetical protein
MLLLDMILTRSGINAESIALSTALRILHGSKPQRGDSAEEILKGMIASKDLDLLENSPEMPGESVDFE